MADLAFGALPTIKLFRSQLMDLIKAHEGEEDQTTYLLKQISKKFDREFRVTVIPTSEPEIKADLAAIPTGVHHQEGRLDEMVAELKDEIGPEETDKFMTAVTLCITLSQLRDHFQSQGKISKV